MLPHSMRDGWFSLGALLASVAIAAGALGAHALRTSLAPPGLELWSTAVRYLLIGAFGLMAIGLASQVHTAPGWPLAGLLLLLGTVVFAGTVAGLALGGPRWLGAVTPVGGVLMILAFLAAALAATRR